MLINILQFKTEQELKHYYKPQKRRAEGNDQLKGPKRQKLDVPEEQNAIVVAQGNDEQGCEQSNLIHKAKEYEKDIAGLLDQLVTKCQNPPFLYPENKANLNKTFKEPLTETAKLFKSTGLSMKAYIATQIARAEKKLKKQECQHQTHCQMELVTETAIVPHGLIDSTNDQDSTVPMAGEDQNTAQDNSDTPIGNLSEMHNTVQDHQSDTITISNTVPDSENSTIFEDHTQDKTGELKVQIRLHRNIKKIVFCQDY